MPIIGVGIEGLVTKTLHTHNNFSVPALLFYSYLWYNGNYGKSITC